MSQPYAKPPITEATIGLHFSSPLAEGDISAAVAQFRGDYPTSQSRFQLSVMAAPGASSVRDEPDGFVMRDASALEAVVIGSQDFSMSLLAPYPGWDGLFDRFMSAYRRLRKTVGFQKIARVGVRFVNRIDIPVPTTGHEVFLAEYFKVSPDSLSVVPDFKYIEYFIAIRIQYAADIKVMLQTGMAPPALVRHMAVALDIDAAIEGEDVPQREPDLGDCLTRLRNAKNDVFERSITDKARQLFEPRGADV